VADVTSKKTETGHEVLAAVLQIRADTLQVLLWQRAQQPDSGRWALPGGALGDTEDVQTSVLRQLADKVDVREVAHVEQLGVFSEPHRVPGSRLVATAFLGLVPCDADPAVPQDTRWHPVAALPETAFDHAAVVRDGRDRLRACQWVLAALCIGVCVLAVSSCGVDSGGTGAVALAVHASPDYQAVCLLLIRLASCVA